MYLHVTKPGWFQPHCDVSKQFLITLRNSKFLINSTERVNYCLTTFGPSMVSNNNVTISYMSRIFSVSKQNIHILREYVIFIHHSSDTESWKISPFGHLYSFTCIPLQNTLHFTSVYVYKMYNSWSMSDYTRKRNHP